MAENKPPAGSDASAAGVPFYERQRQQLKDLLQKRRALERSLAAMEDSIHQKETDYLENTPLGNIITGFDNYTKGTSTAAAAQRRKHGPAEANRVFSKCSFSYNPNVVLSEGATTPGSVTASLGNPTPVSTGFKDASAAAIRGPGGSGGSHATAQASGVVNGSLHGATGVATRIKKGSIVGQEEDGVDGKDPKKVRISFGAGRK